MLHEKKHNLQQQQRRLKLTDLPKMDEMRQHL